jgi:hypothetical protein
LKNSFYKHLIFNELKAKSCSRNTISKLLKINYLQKKDIFDRKEICFFNLFCPLFLIKRALYTAFCKKKITLLKYVFLKEYFEKG